MLRFVKTYFDTKCSDDEFDTKPRAIAHGACCRRTRRKMRCGNSATRAVLSQNVSLMDNEFNFWPPSAMARSKTALLARNLPLIARWRDKDRSRNDGGWRMECCDEERNREVGIAILGCVFCLSSHSLRAICVSVLSSMTRSV